MKSKKDAAAVLSTSDLAVSKRSAMSKHMLPCTRAWEKVCGQRGGGGVLEQRRHCHGWGGSRGKMSTAVACRPRPPAYRAGLYTYTAAPKFASSIRSSRLEQCADGPEPLLSVDVSQNIQLYTRSTEQTRVSTTTDVAWG